LSVTHVSGWTGDASVQVLELDKALVELDALDSRAARVVELRFFGGLKETEAAKALGISVATLKRDWEFARTWLKAQIEK
jgi:DNA-directed RNA polymerase specialized sigma24 family protein